MIRRLTGALARLPIVGAIRGWEPRSRKRDAFAGAAVAAVAVPQGLAYGSVAGLPPVYGLYAAMGGMLGFVLLSRGRVMVGPESSTAALSGATVAAFAAGDPGKAAELAALLGLLVGLVCLALSVLRLGFATDLLSRPVLYGYVVGVSLVVIVGQLPKLFGLTAEGSNIVSIVWHLILDIGDTSLVTLAFGAVLLVTTFLLQRRHLPVPVPLVIIVGATVVTAVLHLDQHGIAVVGPVPRGLPAPRLPELDFGHLGSLSTAAIGIGFVSFADSSALGRSFATRHKERYDVDHEIAAMGVADLVSSCVQGFVVSSSGSRTAVADGSGMVTQLAQLIAAVGVILVLVLLTPLLTLLPIVALAAVVIASTLSLLQSTELLALWRGWRSEAVLAIVTIAAVALAGVVPGLVLAVILALLNLARSSVRPHDAVLALDRGNDVYRDGKRLDDPAYEPGLLVYRVDAPCSSGTWPSCTIASGPCSRRPIRRCGGSCSTPRRSTRWTRPPRPSSGSCATSSMAPASTS